MTPAHGVVATSAVCAIAAWGCSPVDGDGPAEGGPHAAGGGAGDFGDAHEGESDDARPVGVELTFAPTFSAIYREIFATSSCNLGLCHGEGARGGGLSLHPRDAAYHGLVEVASTSRACAELGLPLVAPGAPGASLLLLKLDTEPPCGARMPPDEPLTSAQLAQIRTWVTLGAADD